MESQHLTYFKIENFKRFDSFEMGNLGQFNLIVGDNNVGKTSVLEALTFDEDITTLAYNYFITFWERTLERSNNSEFTKKALQQSHFWQTIFRKKSPIKFTTNNLSFHLELVQHQALSEDEIEVVKKAVVTAIPDQWLKLTRTKDGNWQMIAAYFEGTSEFEYTNMFNLESHVPFVSNNLGYGPELIGMYYQFVNPNKIIRKEIDDNLRKFIPKIEEIRPHKATDNEIIGIILSDNNSLLPLSFFGDGTVKYFRFLLEVLATRNKRLMVDEIGSGIHFTRLKDYWKTVVQLCNKYNVQLFATTHSLECQRAFIEALEDPEMQQYQKDARNITLLENKQGEVKAFTYTFDQFEYSLNIGINTRGGQL